MLRLGLVTLALVAASQNALAQQAFSAGAQIQQIPPVQAPRKSIPDIRVESRETPAAPGPIGAKVLVSALHVTGETLFPEAALVAATGFRPGVELSLSELRTMAAKITSFYNRRGYFVAQAYLPAQDVKDGAVTITVIEGRYGKIVVHNKTNLSNGLIRSILSGLNPGDPVTSAPLERRLLLLSDIPGVAVRSTLVPGAEVGASDLIVDVTPGRRMSGVIEADNAGNRYTGAYRLGATVNFNDILGQGDMASVRALSSFDGLNYVRGSYQAQVGEATVGVAYAALNYRLGKEFKSLDARGSAQIASLYGSYPLIRSYDDNLYVMVDFDAKTFQDKVGVITSVTDKRAGVATVGLYGDHHDTLWGGGWNTFSVYGSYGDLDIRTPAARLADAATARTNGGYGKLTFELSRLQTIAGPLSLYGDIRGQIASKNLDISEKMELGGAYGVRAYPEGEAYGDEGYLASLEARWRLPPWRLPGQLQAIGFVDTGAVYSAKSPWFVGPNRATRSGAGVGLIWADNNNFVLKATYAHRLGDTRVASGPDSSDRFWIQAAKFF